MSDTTAGIHAATLNDVRIVDGYQGNGLDVQFDVYLTETTLDKTCNHPMGEWDKLEPKDDRAKRFKAVLAKFGIDSPRDVARLRESIGQPVDVRAAVYNGKMRYYINTGKAALTDDQVNAKLARLTGDDDNIPF